jgi:hypothetical protein
MNPESRKAKTEALLQEEGVPFLPSLPCIESEEETELRSPEEVGIRIACLYAVVGAAMEGDPSDYKTYLGEHDLWNQVSPDEKSFLSSDCSDRQSVVNFTWRSEAMFLLMWAGGLFKGLPLPRREADTGEIVSKYPTGSPWPFIRELRLRPKDQILDASDLIYRLHWATDQARLEGKPAPAELHPGVVQEWHHAINWLTRYEDQDWDDVTTDT